MTVLVAEVRVSTECESFVLGAASTESVCTDRRFFLPGRLVGPAAASAGTLFVSDATSRMIWCIDDDVARTLAAALAGGVLGATGAGDRVHSLAGLALGPDGTLVVADATGHRVWVVLPDGALRLVANNVYGYRAGPSDDVLFRYPSHVAIGLDGICYVADTGNDPSGPVPPTELSPLLEVPPMTTVTADAPQPGSADPGRSPSTWMAPATLPTPGATRSGGSPLTARLQCSPSLPPGVTTTALVPRWGCASRPGSHSDPTGTRGLPTTGMALRRVGYSGASTMHLRLSGRCLPVAVVSAPHGGMVVATVVPDDVHRPQACLLSVGAV